MSLLLNSALKFENEMGPSPTPPPLSFGYRFCSCGSGPISRCNPGLMISPSTVITPVPGAPSLSQRARHTHSSLSQPSQRPGSPHSKGVTVTSLSPTPVPSAGAALHWTQSNQHLWRGEDLTSSPGYRVNPWRAPCLPAATTRGRIRTRRVRAGLPCAPGSQITLASPGGYC